MLLGFPGAYSYGQENLRGKHNKTDSFLLQLEVL